MNAEMREENRPLREFYPEAKLRQQVHYLFAHRFLPQYVHEYPRDFLNHTYVYGSDPKRFLQSRWYQMELRAGLADFPSPYT